MEQESTAALLARSQEALAKAAAWRRGLPEHVRLALEAWEADRAEREAARARGEPPPRPKRQRLSELKLTPLGRVVAEVARRRRVDPEAPAVKQARRMEAAAQALKDRGFGYLLEER